MIKLSLRKQALDLDNLAFEDFLDGIRGAVDPVYQDVDYFLSHARDWLLDVEHREIDQSERVGLVKACHPDLSSEVDFFVPEVLHGCEEQLM